MRAYNFNHEPQSNQLFVYWFRWSGGEDFIVRCVILSKILLIHGVAMWHYWWLRDLCTCHFHSYPPISNLLSCVIGIQKQPKFYVEISNLQIMYIQCKLHDGIIWCKIMSLCHICTYIVHYSLSNSSGVKLWTACAR